MDALGRDLLGRGDSPAVEAYRERLLAPLDLGEGRGRKALDLGCGDGLEAVYLLRRGWKVEAQDLEPHPRWKELKSQWGGRLNFHLGDAAVLGRLGRGYDMVLEKDMLHHAADPLAVLKEMKRLARPGGRVIVVEANRLNPVFYLHLTLLRGHQHFTRRKLDALLSQAGLEGYQLRRVEARVWPFHSAKMLAWINRIQDAVETFPPFRPFLCYHLAVWSKPAGWAIENRKKGRALAAR